MSSPTTELYSALQMLYTHFNKTLFDQRLPDILFTNQRQTGVMGYFSPNRWRSVDSRNCHEIAINPVYVGRSSLIELMQTLVHEMTHCWQECYGKPSRAGYHNKQWAYKMIELGLMPSTTGKLGGAIIGQTMSDYPMPNGKFIQSCMRLLKDKRFSLPWVDRFAMVVNRPRDNDQLQTALNTATNEAVLDLLETVVDEDVREQLSTPLVMNFGESAFVSPLASGKVKSKYSCPECKLNVWGKPRLNLRCDDCNLSLTEVVD